MWQGGVVEIEMRVVVDALGMRRGAGAEPDIGAGPFGQEFREILPGVSGGWSSMASAPAEACAAPKATAAWAGWFTVGEMRRI